MRAFNSILLALSYAASARAQAVPEGIAPAKPNPEGCVDTVDGNFTIGMLYVPSKAKREQTQAELEGEFACTLKDGIMHDPYNRTASIVANRQFQFDGPPQAGAIYTGGWAVCKNNSLALGPSTIFWRCTSGGFMNLYDENVADQCVEANIIVSLVDQPTSSSSSSSIARSTRASSSSSSSSASASSSSSASLIPITAINGTQTTSIPSNNGTLFSVSVTATPTATDTGASSAASSTGAAVATRVPRKETFGAVIGILGAALIL